MIINAPGYPKAVGASRENSEDMAQEFLVLLGNKNLLNLSTSVVAFQSKEEFKEGWNAELNSFVLLCLVWRESYASLVSRPKEN